MATQAWDREDRAECTIDLGFYASDVEDPVELKLRDLLDSKEIPGMYSLWVHYDQVDGIPLYYHSLQFSHWLAAVLVDIWLQAEGR